MFALRHLFTLARPDYATLPQYKHTHTQTLVHMGRELEGSLDYVGSGGQGGRNRAHLENIEDGAQSQSKTFWRGKVGWWGGGEPGG